MSIGASVSRVEERLSDDVAFLGILNELPFVEVPGGVQVSLGDAYGDERRRVVFQLHVPQLQALGARRGRRGRALVRERGRGDRLARGDDPGHGAGPCGFGAATGGSGALAGRGAARPGRDARGEPAVDVGLALSGGLEEADAVSDAVEPGAEEEGRAVSFAIGARYSFRYRSPSEMSGAHGSAAMWAMALLERDSVRELVSPGRPDLGRPASPPRQLLGSAP